MGLLSRMRSAFPECKLSVSLLWEWLGEQRSQHRAWSGETQSLLALNDETIDHLATLPQTASNRRALARARLARERLAVLAAAIGKTALVLLVAWACLSSESLRRPTRPLRLRRRDSLSLAA